MERYLREKDQRLGATQVDRYTSNGAFVCAALMVGLQPEDYGDPTDQHMAKFWRWAVQQYASDPSVYGFISDTVAALYNRADLQQMKEALRKAYPGALEVYYRLRREFGFKEEEDRDFWCANAQQDDDLQ